MAVCAGSGGDFIEDAKRMGADAFLTGEIDHHEALLARSLGLFTIAAGHYHTERPVLTAIRGYLGKCFKKDGICDIIIQIADEEPAFSLL